MSWVLLQSETGRLTGTQIACKQTLQNGSDGSSAADSGVVPGTQVAEAERG